MYGSILEIPKEEYEQKKPCYAVLFLDNICVFCSYILVYYIKIQQSNKYKI